MMNIFARKYFDGSGLLLPPSGIGPFLTKHVRKVVVETPDNRFLGQFGSSILVKWKGQRYAVMTAHQVRSMGFSSAREAAECVRICSPAGDVLQNIPTNHIKVTIDDGSSFADIVVLSVPQEHIPKADQNSFWPIERWQPHDRPASMYVGYPREDDVMKFGDEGTEHIILRSWSVDMTYDPSEQKGWPVGPSYRIEDKDRELDGLSGGAAFSVYDTNEMYKFTLDGMIVTAGKTIVRTVGTNHIINVIEG